MTALTAVSPELVLVDPDLAAALRATAVAGPWRGARTAWTPAPRPVPPTSLLRRVTVAAGAALLAVLVLEAGAGTPGREVSSEPARRVAPAVHLLPTIPLGRTDAAARPVTAVPAHRAVPPRHHTRPAARHAPPPTVSWHPVQAAAYYDLVLWRDGHRVLDLWPTQPRQALAALPPGRYLWFAYPGLGSRAAGRFGPLAGSGVVVVRMEKNR